MGQVIVGGSKWIPSRTLLYIVLCCVKVFNILSLIHWTNGHLKKNAGRCFLKNFGRGKIKDCGFYHWKDEMKTHRIIYHKTFWSAFLKASDRPFPKATYLVSFRFSGAHWNRQSKIDKIIQDLDFLISLFMSYTSSTPNSRSIFLAILCKKRLFFRLYRAPVTS